MIHTAFRSRLALGCGIVASAAVVLAAVFICTDRVDASPEKGHRLNRALAGKEYENDTVLVTLKDEGRGEQSLRNRVQRVRVPENKTAEEVLEQLEDNPEVEEAALNYKRHATVTPNDTYYANQWHHSDADAGISSEDAWADQTGTYSVVIAIIDSGIDTDHPDIEDNLWLNGDEIADNGIDDDSNGYIDDVNGYDFVDDDKNPNPQPDGVDNDSQNGADNGVTHGTHVGGLVGAVGNNGKGVAGVAWKTKLMAVRVLDDEGGGLDSGIIEGIEYAVDNGADIINMSLGGAGESALLEAAITYAKDNGVLVVAAAGNDGININSTPFYPACYDSVIGVAAHKSSMEAAAFSNYGSNCVDLSAPGYQIFSTVYINAAYGFTASYDYESGTSMSTPIVSGIAALLLSEESSLTRSQLREVITKNTVDIGLGSNFGSGRADANIALDGIGSLENPTTPATVTAYNSSSKSRTFNDGERSADTRPYFTWSAANDGDGIAGYYVYFGTNAHADPVTKGTFQTKRNYEPSAIEGNEVSYYLRVKAKDNDGNASTEAASFEYVIDTETTKPTNLELSRTANGIKVDWDKVKGEHAEKYQVFRKKYGCSSCSWKKKGVISHPTSKYTDTKVKNGVKYRYRVKVKDDLGNKKSSKIKNKRFYPRENVVMAAGPGGSPLVSVWSYKKKANLYSWYAFPVEATNGLEVAVGNVDGDRRDEIVVGLDRGGDPWVRVFEPDGELLSSFLAYNAGFRGGVRVATGDVDDDGVDEIITAPGPGGGPQVRVFKMDGTLLFQFNALDEAFTGGAFVAGVDWNGKGRDEIVVSAGEGGGPTVQIYSSRTTELLAQYSAYDSAFRGGVRVARASFDPGDPDVILSVPEHGTAFVQSVYRGNGTPTYYQTGFFGIGSWYANGGTIAGGDLFQKRADRNIIGSNGGTPAVVNIYSPKGTKLKETVYPFVTFTGAVRVASGWVK
ncbi:MAG: S8 family serine peptidase [Candidatus Kerfeldbacteria bacterium]